MSQPPVAVPSTRPCPWCATPVPVAAARCPSCGAALVEQPSSGGDIPGITQLDAFGARGEALHAEIEHEPDAAESVALPSEAVRREMARLELEALQVALAAAAAAQATPIADASPAGASATPALTPDASDQPTAAAGTDEPTPTPDSASGGPAAS